ncbi:MAG TPA: VOC family protein [Acidobacteriaceae bacterium]|jgi:PhnB protein|nr:VOC family protein [Acidobacteriaceae bacterium]
MSSVKAIPEGYHNVQPYLHVRGAAQAIEFYKKVFGATEVMRMPQPDGRLGHAEIRIGDSVVMLADEAPERGIHGPEHYGGAPMTLMLYIENCDGVYEKAIAAGSKSLREPADQFYGDRMAGVEDPFGFHWYIATHVKDVSMEEMQAAMKEQKA